MTGRFWFYLAVTIVIIAELTWLHGGRNRLNNELARLDNAAAQQQLTSLRGYLGKQTNERKLVSLAKLLKNREAWLLQPIIDRAYELNPNSRDIALLASFFHPELKERVKELDPLYGEEATR